MPENIQTPATYLIESRYWMLNARLVKEDLEPSDFTDIIKTFKGSILNGNSLYAEIARHPLDNYSETTPLLKFTVGKEVLSLLSDKFLASRPGVKLDSIEMWLTDLELLCCYVVFSLDPDIKIKEFEEKEMSIVDLLSSLQPDLEKVFCLLESKKVISVHGGFLFGVPEILGKENLHTADNSYLYTWHLFFPHNTKTLKKTVSDYNLVEDYMKYAGGRVYTGWGILLWEPEEVLTVRQMIDRIFIDSIPASESVVYHNSIKCFTGFLELIIGNKKVDCNYIRNICNISHLSLQHIKLWKRNLTVEQEDYNERLRGVLKLDDDKNDYDSSETILKNAVEGVEVKENQKSGRTIEMVLSFFTALSLYSVTTDLYTIITTENTVAPIHPLSLRTILIFLATVIVLLFFYMLRRERRK
jgi:hypothetical protein